MRAIVQDRYGPPSVLHIEEVPTPVPSAEYICIKEKGAIALMPPGLSFEDAAAVCDGTNEALATLRAARQKTGNVVLTVGDAAG